MNNRYKNLLSPIQVGGALFRNRMTATAATLHYIQGTEPYPTEKWITLIANRARNGAASVQINHMENGSPAKTGVESIDSMGAHFSMLDINDSSTHNYVCQMIDAIRYYGALAVVEPKGDLPRMGPPPGGMPGQEKSEPSGKGKPDERVQGRPDPAMPDPAMPDPAMPDPAMGGKMDFMAMERMVEEWRKTPERGGTAYSGPLHPPMCNELTKQQIKDYISSVCKNALLMKALGFDMFSFHNSYRSNLGAQFWSPRCNTRTDEYGGSVENRARFLLELFDAVKQTVGKDFPLECLISGEEDQGGNTVEDTIEFARLAEGKIDILHIRSGDIDPQHPLGYTTSRENPCPNLAAAAAVKASVAARGGKLLVGVSAGLHDPDFCEEIIASGKADFVHMARSWICDSEYGTKIYEGRGEDITPCARCNKCHVPNVSDRFRSFCTVNPQIGLEDKLDRMIKPVEKIKNVAVIGGGPGGMYAAITCAERGHKVTLFEKAPELGGQLSHTDYPSFKWPLADFKNFLANKLTRVGVEVRLNSDMTRESLAESGSYDDVIVAIGPRFVRPSNLPGAERENVWLATEVYGREKELPENIVVIGGSEIGVETALYLEENGHRVTVMTRQADIATDAAAAHYVSMLRTYCMSRENFHFLTEVSYKAINDEGVVYTGKDGIEKTLPADAVVLSTGAIRTPAESGSFYGVGNRTWYIGDCIRIGNVHMAVAAGYGTANQI